jgi:hypothetical protein
MDMNQILKNQQEMLANAQHQLYPFYIFLGLTGLLIYTAFCCMGIAALIAATSYRKWVNHKIRIESTLTESSAAWKTSSPTQSPQVTPSLHDELQKRYGPQR